jgi:predicted nucleic acid-binding protein
LKDLFVLDACSLIAVLSNENGADKVKDVMKMALLQKTDVIINRINLLEVYYVYYRDKGKAYANRVASSVRHSVISIKEFSEDIFYEAGRLKAAYRISLADSVALAQTLVSDGTLLTADHHEFDFIEKNEKIRFEWFR